MGALQNQMRIQDMRALLVRRNAAAIADPGVTVLHPSRHFTDPLSRSVVGLLGLEQQGATALLLPIGIGAEQP
uniref:Uncharacterized protein n=1 Tax=Arundo donax TaxID=35708 RepID=A0A0A9H543_ARUDO